MKTKQTIAGWLMLAAPANQTRFKTTMLRLCLLLLAASAAVASPLLTPPIISIRVSGNTLTLSWPTDHLGWTLQTQTNSLAKGLGNNWVAVPGSGSATNATITINPANPAVFFRLRSP